MTRFTACSIAVLICAGCAATAPGPAPISEGADSFTATYLSPPPAIDGDIDGDATWKAVPWTRRFTGFAGKPAPADAGRAKIGWDFRGLYVAFETPDADIQAKVRPRDGAIWSDDCLEIFLDPGGRRASYTELGISPTLSNHDVLEVVRYAKGDPAFFSNFSFNGLRQAVGKLPAGGWTVEAFIPWGDLPMANNLPPKPGDLWHMNLVQMDRDAKGKTASTLSRLKGGSAHEVASFADLRFAPLEAPAAAPEWKPTGRTWSLADHLGDVRVESTLMGNFRGGKSGWKARRKWGNVTPPRPGDKWLAGGPKGILNAHPADRDGAKATDPMRIHLPDLKFRRVQVSCRMHPAKKDRYGSYRLDGVGLAVRSAPKGGTPKGGKPRLLAERWISTADWQRIVVEVPAGERVTVELDRGPVFTWSDGCQIAVDGELAE